MVGSNLNMQRPLVTNDATFEGTLVTGRKSADQHMLSTSASTVHEETTLLQHVFLV